MASKDRAASPVSPARGIVPITASGKGMLEAARCHAGSPSCRTANSQQREAEKEGLAVGHLTLPNLRHRHNSNYVNADLSRIVRFAPTVGLAHSVGPSRPSSTSSGNLADAAQMAPPEPWLHCKPSIKPKMPARDGTIPAGYSCPTPHLPTSFLSSGCQPARGRFRAQSRIRGTATAGCQNRHVTHR